MAGEELGGGHAAAAFFLHFEQTQRALAAGADEAGLVGGEDLAGRGGRRRQVAGTEEFGPPGF